MSNLSLPQMAATVAIMRHLHNAIKAEFELQENDSADGFIRHFGVIELLDGLSGQVSQVKPDVPVTYGEARQYTGERIVVVNVLASHQERIDAGIQVKAMQPVGAVQVPVQAAARHVRRLFTAVLKAVGHEPGFPARLAGKLIFNSETCVVFIQVIVRAQVKRLAVDHGTELAALRK